MKTITIGREEGTNTPRLAVRFDGKTVFVGAAGSVSRKVSREHCQITLSDAGTIASIADVTTNNFMFVNGRECKSRNDIKLSDTIELGPDRYKLDLAAVMKAVLGSASFHIAPLKKVYDDYQKAQMDLQVRQGQIGALSSVPMVLTMAASLLAILVPDISSSFRVFMGGTAVVLIVLFIVIRIRMAKSFPLKRKELEDKYRKEFVCPNPVCHRYLALRYDDLLDKKVCPHCKCRLEE